MEPGGGGRLAKRDFRQNIDNPFLKPENFGQFLVGADFLCRPVPLKLQAESKAIERIVCTTHNI
jgi:hypothetical protein